MFGLVDYRNLWAELQLNVSQTFLTIFLALAAIASLSSSSAKRSSMSFAHSVAGEYVAWLSAIQINHSCLSVTREGVLVVRLTGLIMTKPRRLNLFLKKILSMSRHDMETASGRQLSFSFSRESSQRSWSTSCRSLESCANFDSEDEDECCSSTPPNDVPDGCLPVYVGRERRRFVIPTAHLSNSIFRTLLAKSEDEYGLRADGGLRIPCSPDVFEHFLWWLQGQKFLRRNGARLFKSF